MDDESGDGDKDGLTSGRRQVDEVVNRDRAD